MKLLVHYGRPKTGTTSLQHALYRSRRMLQKHGILYPVARHPREDHRLLSALFKLPQDVHPDTRGRFGGDAGRLRAAAQALFEDIRRQAGRSRPDLLVLSSESFFHTATPEGQDRFRGLLAELASEVEICIYFRDPADLYLSSMQQAVKRSKGIRPPRPMQDRRGVEVIEAAFGRPVAACAFDREQLLGGDIVRDFEQRFLAPHLNGPTVASLRLNESISAEALAILDRYRRWRHREAVADVGAEIAQLARIIAAIEVRNGRFHKPRLKPQWADEIRRASTDLLWLRDRYGLVFGKVNYEAIDGQPITDVGPAPRPEDIIEVDEAWRDEIVLELLSRGLRLRESLSLHTMSARVFRRLGVASGR